MLLILNMTKKVIMQLLILNFKKQKTSFGLDNFFINNYSQYKDFETLQICLLYQLPNYILTKLCKSYNNLD